MFGNLHLKKTRLKILKYKGELYPFFKFEQEFPALFLFKNKIRRRKWELGIVK
ncbi:hypothetical protein HMPREF0202_02007 [Cetobacterium somerae ATCC BAA-474]|jgi:hypothetical protein|uniref:Uncharacterized protein n=1 Tax=Cetobacterium somerae ATCC BAA-474 TaxID=1319815 RepID=U7V969_9FUSO|nr:hypothetical protein HMPREF0202_02007 [Cetobacterium somerae ATCC BAA-474]